MKVSSSSRKSWSKHQKPSGLEGNSLAPPEYGIDYVDSQVGVVQRREGVEKPGYTVPENNTGLPNPLKSGIESLSGYSMDDVNVHYNSSKPALIQAHAYAQGTDIHVGPGHERHLPHEAWHVVQQKQGRVKPSIQMKGLAINADASLEQEADVMGAKALTQSGTSDTLKESKLITSATLQPWWPLGHRTITKSAFGFYDAKYDKYAKDVQEYLALRSPDMDFAQDEVLTMEGGGSIGKANKDRMINLVKRSKKTEFILTRDADKAEARRMWDENELHVRKEWYATHHGEGGKYKSSEEVGASINKKVTKLLVDVAIAKYNAGQKTAGLSVLSDALHQAEDRGAHMEGEAFKGHDFRLTVAEGDRPEGGINVDNTNINWQSKNTEYTDNASKNPDGAKKALKLAIDDVFKPFLAGVTDDKVVMGGQGVSRRQAKFDAKGGSGTTAHSDDVKAMFPGKTKAGKITEITEQQMDDFVLPTTHDVVGTELAEAEAGVKRYQDMWVISELTERVRSRLAHSSWRTSTSKREEVGHQELNKLIKIKGWFAGLGGATWNDETLQYDIDEETRNMWVARAVRMYEWQRKKGDRTKPAPLDEPT